MKAVYRQKLIALSASKKNRGSSHLQLDNAPESSGTKRSQCTNEDQMTGNNQIQGQNQPNRNKKNYKKNQQDQFFEKIDKIDTPLARLTKGHRGTTQTIKIRNEKGDIKTETVEIKKNHKILLQELIQNLKIQVKWTIFQTPTRCQC